VRDSRSASPDDARLLHAACFFALFCVGFYATSFGPALPFFARKLNVDLDTAGLLITGIFVGSIIASGAVTLGLGRGQMRIAVATGLLVASLGLFGLGFAHQWWVALGAVVLLGLGDGLIVAGAHVLIANTSRNVPAGITRLNLWFAVGAVCGPLWAGALLANNFSLRPVYSGLGLVLLVGAALMAASRRSVEMRGDLAVPGGRATTFSGFIALMGLLLFLYVGAEIGLGSWVSSYAERTAGAGVFAAAAITAGYWGALALGRVLAEWFLRLEIGAVTVLRWSIIGGLASSAALALVGGNIWLGAAAAFATGLCFGPIWPATIALSSAGNEQHVPAAMVTIGNAGGILLPWAQGVLLVSQGARTGVALTAVLCAAMLALSFLAQVRSPSRAIHESA